MENTNQDMSILSGPEWKESASHKKAFDGQWENRFVNWLCSKEANLEPVTPDHDCGRPDGACNVCDKE